MRRAWRWTVALLVGITAAFASALEVPTDADVFVTDAGSRIVGIGRVAAGTSFELVLEDGFAGPAVVVWLSFDGGVRTTEVVVADGVVWVDGEALTSILPDTFVEVHVRLAKELGTTWPPAVGQGPPADVPGLAKGRDPPGPPADGPPASDPPGPADDGPPGRSEDPPGRRP